MPSRKYGSPPEGPSRTPPEFRYPGDIRRVRFRERKNRFLVEVEGPSGTVFPAHLRNPGRMRELLREGDTWGHVVSASPGSPRSTRWTLVDVESPADPSILVSVDAVITNHLVHQWLGEGWLFPEVSAWGPWRREVPWMDCRFDEGSVGGIPGAPPRALLEVKSSNLRGGPAALFPDAPTRRGAHHVDRLTEFASSGGRAALLFVAQRCDVREIRPYGAMDPRFSRAVEWAAAAGVHILGCRVRVRPGGIRFAGRLPVRAPRWTPLGPPEEGHHAPPRRRNRGGTFRGRQGFPS